MAFRAGEREAVQSGLEGGSGFGTGLFVEEIGAFEADGGFAGLNWREFGHFEPSHGVVEIFAVAAEDGLDLQGEAFVGAARDFRAKGASRTFEKIGSAHDG